MFVQVMLAKEKFIKGDLFEAVLSQTFTEPCSAKPSQLFKMLQKRNPAPFGFIISLQKEEWLGYPLLADTHDFS